MPDMKYTKTIALITTLLCFLQGQGLALAQDNPNQYNYLYLTIRNGLCDNSIRTIHKDHNSFMWFGTSNGLDRYDGYELKPTPQLPGNRISLLKVITSMTLTKTTTTICG